MTMMHQVYQKAQATRIMTQENIKIATLNLKTITNQVLENRIVEEMIHQMEIIAAISKSM